MERIEKTRKKMREKEVDGILIDSPYEILWLLEKSESYNLVELSPCMLLTEQEVYLIGDIVTIEKFGKGTGDFQSIKADTYSFLVNNYIYTKELRELLKYCKINRLGLFRKGYEFLDEVCKIIFIEDIVADLAMVKTHKEIEIIRDTSKIMDEVADSIVYGVGITEIDLRHAIEVLIYQKGGDKRAFPATCAFGNHTQDPQSVPGPRKLQQGDLIRTEFGAIYRGYSCDLARTHSFGKVSEKISEMHNYVLGAFEKVLDFIKPGRIAQAVDAVARDYLKEKGLGDYFLNILGYPVGMIRTGLFLGPSSTGVLKSGMVFGITPAVCIPGWGGIKIGDIVLVTDDGCEVLTKASKSLGK